MTTLFRPSSSEPVEDKTTFGSVEPPTKKARFFQEDSDDDDDFIIIESPRPSRRQEDGSRRHGAVNASKTLNKMQKNGKVSWQRHFFGEIVVQGYAVSSYSHFTSLKPKEVVTIYRPKPDPLKAGKRVAKEDTVVRFKNSKGVDVGRIGELDAEWMSRLMDLDIIEFEGNCLLCDSNFRSGDTIVISLTVYILITAFSKGTDKEVSTYSEGKKSFHDDSKETEHEKMLRERKSSLNRLFDKVSLQPVTQSALAAATTSTSPSSSKGKSAGSGSKRGLIESYDTTSIKKTLEEGDEDGEEMSEGQLSLVYSKAIKNDSNLPEMEPASTFALSLRGYQKQALRWMSSMEGGSQKAREVDSMHPLWERYMIPVRVGTVEDDEVFYYNPYSGELTLQFPQASETLSGGILADEMGLGKTIMVAALIHTNTPESAVKFVASNVAQVEDDVDKGDAGTTSLESEATSAHTEKRGRTAKQAHLGGHYGHLDHNVPSKLSAAVPPGSPVATLVVAPMTLLSQWCNEIQRSSKRRTQVLMYYGNNRTNIQDEIDAGTRVVVTSYGTLCSDFRLSGLDDPPLVDGKKTSKKKKSLGLFGVQWFRIVLDEAHVIKSSKTNNAKATYGLKGDRRWCLTGTPIVNRLEDLYSLLHFIKLEPWGISSFFKTFITVPFSKKDPKAIEIIQIVLESVLLRREKKMKDKNGNFIVSLPSKHVLVDTLTFTKEERQIYEALYQNAKSQFLGYAQKGTVLQNVTAIFSILMRLRQAVLHPSLVLKRLSENLILNKAKQRTPAEKASDKVDERVKEMIIRYSGGMPPLSQQANDEDLEMALECSVCFEPLDTPVTLPLCGHTACKMCFLNAFTDAEEKGENPTCPVCGKGPITEQDLLDIQKGRSPKKNAASPARRRKGYSISTSSEAESDDGSSQTEVLTIDDSSDEDIEEEPRTENGLRSSANPNGNERSRRASNTRNATLSSDSSDAGQDEDGQLGNLEDTSNPSAVVSGLLQDDLRSSTKLDALVKSLKAARTVDREVKAVVFSQFTGFLDLIERVINREGISYVRLDGSMSQRAREKVVHYFTTVESGCVLLASLKAGGVGLNLIAATHVYIMDCWWNSAVENQAIDRIHRFGQMKEVHVTRFLIESSIDQKMLALQERKTRVIKGALGIGEDGTKQKQLAEDLAAIFAD